VDCFSFVVMKEERLKMALCFDEHFRQAGFEVPLIRAIVTLYPSLFTLHAL